MLLVMHQHPLHPPKLLFFFVAASSVLIPVSQPIEASAGTGSCTPAQSIAKANEKKRASRTGTAISYSPAAACWVLMTWVYLLCSMKFVQKKKLDKASEKYTNNVAYPYGFADSRYIHVRGYHHNLRNSPSIARKKLGGQRSSLTLLYLLLPNRPVPSWYRLSTSYPPQPPRIP